ncbi:MAG: serine/threonine protein kinase [Myxococcales bacterium]|nr:serine/threonine protein kinase [Myxococcales bacterium]
MTEQLKKDQQRIRELRDPLIGKVIDEQFHILTWIGKGAYSNVYKAAQTTVRDRIVAVKVIRRAQAAYAASQQGGTDTNPFEHEVAYNLRLKNAAVVRAIQAGRTEDGIDYIAMEYVDGTNLDKYIRDKGPLPISEVITLADNLLGFAEEMHQQGIAHCDLKPDNVMRKVLPSGQIRFKVLDLGQTRHLNMPQSGDIIGTPAFIAPEVAMGFPVDVRSEVYACGTILYEALTGRHAIDIERHSVEGYVDYLRDADSPIPTHEVLELRPDCPPAIAEVIEWALNRHPADRPLTASDFRDAVLEAAEESGSHPLQTNVSTGVFAKIKSFFSRITKRK